MQEWVLWEPLTVLLERIVLRCFGRDKINRSNCHKCEAHEYCQQEQAVAPRVGNIRMPVIGKQSGTNIRFEQHQSSQHRNERSFLQHLLSIDSMLRLTQRRIRCYAKIACRRITVGSGALSAANWLMTRLPNK